MPLILVDPEITSVKDGVLGDIAPTILSLLGVEKPLLMTQASLV